MATLSDSNRAVARLPLKDKDVTVKRISLLLSCA